MKKSQLAEMRRAFAEETAEALREQEKQLSVLIARLEVSLVHIALLYLGHLSANSFFWLYDFRETSQYSAQSMDLFP